LTSLSSARLLYALREKNSKIRVGRESMILLEEREEEEEETQ
jgi:hypothetical protein